MLHRGATGWSIAIGGAIGAGLILRLRNFHSDFDVLNPFERAYGRLNVGGDLLRDFGITGGDLDADKCFAIIEFDISNEAEGDDVTAESGEFDRFKSCFDAICIHCKYWLKKDAD